MAFDMSAAFKITAKVDGGQSVANLNNQLKQLGQQGEMSAKQLRQAYQQLPAQLQDVAVSLAGGQNPLMVLIQQGSQVSTQFGGMGNAIRGITSLLTPARLGFAALAGAIGAVAVAAVQGYQESIQLQKALLTTGNFAGLTADSFDRAAARIKSATGSTTAASRELLMGAAGSGAFGPASVEAVTRAMASLQKLTGQSSEDILKIFKGMSSGVGDWAAETNKSYNFLSIETYKRIRELEEQKRFEEAAVLASNAFNAAIQGRVVQVGFLEQKYIDLKRALSEYGSAFQRFFGPETLGDRLGKLEQMAANAQALRDRMAARGQTVPSGESPESKALNAEIEALREQIRLQDRSATATATRAAVTQKAIKDENEADKKRKAAASEAQQQEKQRLDLIIGLQSEITRLTAGENALTTAKMRRLGATEKEIQQAEALMARRDQIVAADKAAEEAKRQAEQNDNSRRQMLQDLSDSVLKLAESEDELTISRLRRVGASEAELTQAREMLKQRRLMTEAEKAKADADRKIQQQENERKQTLVGLNEQIISLAIGEDEATIAKMRGLGATEAEIEAVRRLQKTLSDLKETKRLTDEGARVTKDVRTPEEVLADDIERLTQLRDADAISLETYTRAVIKAREAYLDLGKNGKGVMDDLKQAIEGWGRSAADAFVDFAFSAKDATKSVEDRFKEMVSSILKDIARMLIYRNVTQPLFSAIGAMFPFAGGGVMTSNGPLPLKAYASGGIANSPQLAMFGEGRMPEAYVPLPDGRSIPVTMQGGVGGDTNVVVNVSMETGQTNAQSDNQRGTDIGLVIASVVKQELINQRRPGGLLAAA